MEWVLRSGVGWRRLNDFPGCMSGSNGSISSNLIGGKFFSATMTPRHCFMRIHLTSKILGSGVATPMR